MRSNRISGNCILSSALDCRAHISLPLTLPRSRTATHRDYPCLDRIFYAMCGLEIFAMCGLRASLFTALSAIYVFAYLTLQTLGVHRR